MADPQLGKPAQVSEEDAAAYAHQRKIMEGAGDLMGMIVQGPAKAGWSAVREIAGAVPMKDRARALIEYLKVVHPDTKEFRIFRADDTMAALKQAEAWGTKIKMGYRLPEVAP